MKKLSLLILAIVSMIVSSQAQTAYNPFTQNIHFEPEPTAFGFECGTTQTVAFTMGLTTVADASGWQNDPLQITICIVGFRYSGTAASVVSGSYASNFDWAYDSFSPECIVGTQNQTLHGTGNDPFNPDPLSTGEIKLTLQVPETAPIGSVLGVNVNLQPAGYMAQFNSTNDDNESTQTQTFCDLKIKGNVFYDTTLVDDNVNGRPFNNPNDTLLYAHLVDSATGNVLAIKEILQNGTFEFTSVTPQKTYYVVLSTIQGTVGSTPPTAILPSSWVNVNEDCCDRSGTDNSPDGENEGSGEKATMLNVNFGIYSPTPTPVTLTYFFVNEQKCKSLLTWATSQESNSAYAEVMRKDGENGSFRKIATVQTIGNSANTQVYSYVDESVKNDGTLYQYSLRFVDLDGKITNSEVKKLSISCEEGKGSIVNIFPNPSTGDLNILYVTESENTELEVGILDLAGRTIASQTSALNNGNTLIKMDVSSFAKGAYILRYHEVDGVNTGSIKFVKE